MNDAAAKRILRVIERRGKLVYPKIGLTLKRLDEWAADGFSTRTGEGTGGPVSSSDTSTPTEAVAIAAVMAKRDQDRYGADRAELIEILEEMDRLSQRMVKIVDDAEVVPVNPVTKKPIFPEPEGCKPCSRIIDPETGKPHENGYQEIHTRVRLPGMADDAPPVPWCRWHASFFDTWGCEPADAIVLWHLSHPGQPMRGTSARNMIRDHHPDAWTQVQRARANGTPRAFGLDRLAEDAAAQEVPA